jgi:hypothetical protein
VRNWQSFPSWQSTLNFGLGRRFSGKLNLHRQFKVSLMVIHEREREAPWASRFGFLFYSIASYNKTSQVTTTNPAL